MAGIHATFQITSPANATPSVIVRAQQYLNSAQITDDNSGATWINLGVYGVSGATAFPASPVKGQLFFDGGVYWTCIDPAGLLYYVTPNIATLTAQMTVVNDDATTYTIADLVPFGPFPSIAPADSTASLLGLPIPASATTVYGFEVSYRNNANSQGELWTVNFTVVTTTGLSSDGVGGTSTGGTKTPEVTGGVATISGTSVPLTGGTSAVATGYAAGALIGSYITDGTKHSVVTANTAVVASGGTISSGTITTAVALTSGASTTVAISDVGTNLVLTLPANPTGS